LVDDQSRAEKDHREKVNTVSVVSDEVKETLKKRYKSKTKPATTTTMMMIMAMTMAAMMKKKPMAMAENDIPSQGLLKARRGSSVIPRNAPGKKNAGNLEK
jgi:hypothetical protein